MRLLILGITILLISHLMDFHMGAIAGCMIVGLSIARMILVMTFIACYHSLGKSIRDKYSPDDFIKK